LSTSSRATSWRGSDPATRPPNPDGRLDIALRDAENRETAPSTSTRNHVNYLAGTAMPSSCSCPLLGGGTAADSIRRGPLILSEIYRTGAASHRLLGAQQLGGATKARGW
jgi:hypothetical protein